MMRNGPPPKINTCPECHGTGRRCISGMLWWKRYAKCPPCLGTGETDAGRIVSEGVALTEPEALELATMAQIIAELRRRRVDLFFIVADPKVIGIDTGIPGSATAVVWGLVPSGSAAEILRAAADGVENLGAGWAGGK